MNSMKCQICLEPYDELDLCPHICNKCGNSICNTCLRGIYNKTNIYRCPFCKFQSQEFWTKNRTILNSLAVQKDAIMCEAHNKKVISFCCNAQCTIPPGICQKSECSKLHKQRGTNSIAISLIQQQIQKKDDENLFKMAVEIFYNNVEQMIIKQLKIRKQKKIQSLETDLKSKLKLGTKINELMKKLKNNKSQIKSKDMAILKRQILEQEDKQQISSNQQTKKIINQQRDKLQSQLPKLIQQVQINYSPTIIKSIIKESSKKQSSKLSNQNSIKKQISPQFKLIKTSIMKQFTSQLIFSSQSTTYGIYFKKIGGQPNLVFRIQMEDGLIFGAYFKKPFADNFAHDYFVVDSQAFVFWANRNKIFKASFGSQAQYDISPSYLLSVGNTYKFDGFWFKSDFRILNPTAKRKEIFSNQYQNLIIPLTTFNVRKVEIFQLLM